MEAQEIEQGLFETFVAGCDTRRERILSTLAACSADDVSPEHALESIAVELHDHVGDARLLGLEKVSSAAAELEQLVRLWQDSLLRHADAATIDDSLARALQTETFRAWLDQLTSISQRFANHLGDGGQVRQIQQLRLEISKAIQEARGDFFAESATGRIPHLIQKKVLLIDDSAISSQMVIHTLEELGLAVRAAADAATFRSLLAEWRPHVLVLDINMPGISGEDLCREVRGVKEGREIPICIFSSLDDQQLRDLTERSGATGFVSKQDGVEALRDKIQGWLVAHG